MYRFLVDRDGSTDMGPCLGSLFAFSRKLSDFTSHTAGFQYLHTLSTAFDIGRDGREGVSQGGFLKEATSFQFVSLVFCSFGIPY